MPIPLPRILAGRPRVAFAASRVLSASCTTRYGEAPGDDEIAALVADFPKPRPENLPWFPIGHRDTPTGTVWQVLVCPPVDPRMRRNLSAGVEASPTIPVPCEILLPEVLWAVAVLGSGSTRTRGTQSPQGMWISEWNEGMPERIDGPYALDSQLFHAWKEQRGDVVEEVPWRDPDVETLETLASDHPEAQLLSPSQARRRGESLANRTLVVRLSAFIALVLVLAVVVRAPVWWMEHVLASTENRLASVRPQLDRLDRIRRQAGIDASFLDSSDAAFRPSASPGPLLDGMARRLGGGVRLQLLQIESPPGDTSWTMRTDARLDDWRGVASLVDSLRKVPGVADVHVETQQREKDKVHLVLSLKGNWP